MARKKVLDLDADNCMGFGDKKGQVKMGEEVSGYYIGSKGIKTKFGAQELHILQGADGNQGYFGSKQLNDKLSKIPPGTMVFIKFTKKISVPNGTMKCFEVEYDDEDTIHVDQVQVNFREGGDANPESGGGEADDPDYQGDEQGDDQGDGSEPAYEEPPTPPPARTQAPRAPAQQRTAPPANSAVSAASRERAQALLTKKR